MTHEELNELYELYALGVLDEPASAEIERHLSEGCEYCREHVQTAFWTTSSLAGLAEAAKAPRALRDRVLTAVSPRPVRGWKFATWGLGAVAAGLLCAFLWSLSQTQNLHSTIDALTSQRDDLRGRVQALNYERNQLLNQRGELQSVVAAVGSPGTRALQFGEGDNAPHGRVFLSPAGGVVLVGLRLPQLPPDRTFQLWIVPSQGAPRSAGVFRSNTSGEAIYSSQVSRNGLTPAAVAVSVEPRGGSPAPTTKPFIVVPVKS